jgi:hypothetical protein
MCVNNNAFRCQLRDSGAQLREANANIHLIVGPNSWLSGPRRPRRRGAATVPGYCCTARYRRTCAGKGIDDTRVRVVLAKSTRRGSLMHVKGIASERHAATEAWNWKGSLRIVKDAAVGVGWVEAGLRWGELLTVDEEAHGRVRRPGARGDWQGYRPAAKTTPSTKSTGMAIR